MLLKKKNPLLLNECYGFLLRLARKHDNLQLYYFKAKNNSCEAFFFQERIESATDVLKAILNPVVDVAEEISWPPRDPEALILMEKVS